MIYSPHKDNVDSLDYVIMFIIENNEEYCQLVEQWIYSIFGRLSE